MTQMRWTDPTGLRAQTLDPVTARAVAHFEAAALKRSAGCTRSAGGLATQVNDAARRAAASLGDVLGRIRERENVADDRLVDLAWDCFAAGFEASRTKDAARPGRPGTPAGPRDDSLAHLVADLSPRRLEVLELVAKGLTNREIGDALGISAHTVKAHVAGVLEALDLTNRTEAAVALREFEAEQAVAAS